MLDLLYAVLPLTSHLGPSGATRALKMIEESDPTLLRDPKLIELKSRMIDP
jgi:hypothetical protein